jgi:hypothetical protein
MTQLIAREDYPELFSSNEKNYRSKIITSIIIFREISLHQARLGKM